MSDSQTHYSSGSSFDKLLRDAGYEKEADELLRAANKKEKNAAQPSGENLALIKKIKKWRILAVILCILIVILSIFSIHIYESRYVQGMQEKYHEIMTYPDTYHLVHVSNAMTYVIHTYNLDEIISQYQAETTASVYNNPVYTTKNGHKYHKADCQIVKGKDSLTKYNNEKEAQEQGYSACEICYG